MSKSPGSDSASADSESFWTGRRTALALGVLVLAALALRIVCADGRELWNDDVGRLRMARLPWDAILWRLPHLDNLKSPYLAAFDRIWSDVAGTSGLLSLRSHGIVLGTAYVVLGFVVARAVTGTGRALFAATLYALGPFFVRWSVEMHHYSLAALGVFAAYAIALGAERLSRRRWIAIGAAIGFGTGVFPPVAPAFAGLLLVPAVRRTRDLRSWLFGAATALLLAAPALGSILASREAFAPAYEGGRAWSPYFNWRESPVTLFSRMAGLPNRGATTLWVAVSGIGAGVLGVVLGTVGSGRRNEERDRRWRRFAVVAGAGVPCLVLMALSWRSVGVFTDRYVHAAACLYPVALVAALPGRKDLRAGAPGRIRALVTAVLIVSVTAAPLALGLYRVAEFGDSFPRALTNRSLWGSRLVDQTLVERPAPDLLFVHGDVQFSHVLLRSAAARTEGLALRHLSTDAWARVAAANDTSQTCVPPSYGWPFNNAEMMGDVVTVGPGAIRSALDDGRSVWVLMEKPAIERSYHLEEQEVDGGLDTVFQELPTASSEEREHLTRTRMLPYFGLSSDRPHEVLNLRRAMLVLLPAD